MSVSQMAFEDKETPVGSFFFSWNLVIFASYKVSSFNQLVFVCPLKYSPLKADDKLLISCSIRGADTPVSLFEKFNNQQK